MRPDEGSSEYRARAGSLTLSYLNSTLGWDGLRAILAQAATGIDLIDESTLVVPDGEEAILDIFADRYLLEPADPDDDPDDVDTRMQPTPAGREAPLVGTALYRWLGYCPSGAITPGDDSGEVLWPLLSGWVSTIVHAVAVEPRSAPEIQEAVGVLDLEAVDMRIALLMEADLLRTLPPESPGGEVRFEPTEWLRLGVGPLAASARMELRHPREDTAPLAAADVEAILRLALPLLSLPGAPSGNCSLTVELEQGVLCSPVDLTARVEEGLIVACERGVDLEAEAALAGSTGGWLDAMVEGSMGGIESDGDRRMTRDLLHGLHRELFA